MYRWLDDALAAQHKPQHRARPVASPATETEIAKLERLIGRPLPATHRAFLATHNGLEYVFGYQLNALSTEQIIAWHETNGFATRTQADDYYAELPARLLVVAKVAHGSDVYALDLRSSSPEPPVIYFDAEDGCKTKFPSFEAMMLHVVADAAGMYDAPEIRKQLLERLTARGVVNAGDWDADFSHWQPLA